LNSVIILAISSSYEALHYAVMSKYLLFHLILP
jgi:hypothetical protein